MRLFLAIEIPPSVQKEIERQLAPLVKWYSDCNFVAAGNYHVTIYFFGEIDEVKKIVPRLERVLYDEPQFYMYSHKLGLFMQHKITVYLDFLREKKLEKIATDIEREFNTFSPSQKYVAHLTVARYRIPAKQQYFVFKKRLDHMDIDVSFPVRKLTLFQSILSGPKPIYKKITTFPLNP